MEKDPRILKLLERMLDGKIVEIKPVLDVSSKLGFRYPVVEELLGTSAKESLHILENLAEKGILKRNFYDKLPFCPKCNSFELRLSTHCPKCDSANITREEVLEHFSCGYVGPEEKFKTDEGYVCPKCKKKLRLIGTDYQRIGPMYKCQSCGNIFNEPVEKEHCLTCLEYFPKGEITEGIIHFYQLNEAKKNRLAVELKPKRELEEFLRREGYEVQSSAKIEGQSGVEHEVDLYAVKKAGIFEHRIVLSIDSADVEVGPEAIGKLFATSYDVGATDTIIIAIPKLSDEARRLANYYRIRVFEAQDLKKAIEQLTSKVGD